MPQGKRKQTYRRALISGGLPQPIPVKTDEEWLREAEAAAGPGPTSGPMGPTRIGPGNANPETKLGLLTTPVTGQMTEEEALAAMQEVGKIPPTLEQAPFAMGSAVNPAEMLEAAKALYLQRGAGQSVARMATALKDSGYKFGPMRTAAQKQEANAFIQRLLQESEQKVPTQGPFATEQLTTTVPAKMAEHPLAKQMRESMANVERAQPPPQRPVVLGQRSELARILGDPSLPDNGYADTVKTLSEAALGHELFRVQKQSTGLSAHEVTRRVELLRQELADRVARRTTKK
jgi:hypothetical protein